MVPFLASAVGPSGKVFAQDIHEDMLQQVVEKSEAANLSNVTTIFGTAKNPNLPENGVDLAFSLDSYHHFDYPAEMLTGIRRSLRQDGRLAIVDYYRRPGSMPGRDAGWIEKHIRLDEDDVVKEVEANGFRLLSRVVHIPGRQYVLIFGKR